MITPDMIPDEVVKAASREYELYIYDAVSADGIRLAIAAALNAWPGMGVFEDETGWDVHIELPLLIPLPPQEKQDDR